MTQAGDRQRARQRAAEAKIQESAARSRRLDGLLRTARTAVQQRAELVAATERRLGVALYQLTDVEGLTLRAALDLVNLAGGEISVREGTRLRKIGRAAAATDQADDQGDDQGDHADA